MFKIKTLILIVGFLICFESKAYNAKYTVDNGQVKAAISIQDLTRIFIRNDRIARVFGLSDEFSIQNESNKGQIFIKPKKKSKPIFISIFTEKGKTVDLFLLPKDIPSTAIGITINKG